MQKSNLKVVDRSGTERAALAAAISSHQALSGRLAAAIAAGDWTKRAALKRNVELAEASVETAKADAARFLTDQTLGKSDEVAPISIKEARTALQDAKDQLEIWETASASLQTEVKKLREEVADAKIRLDGARLKLVESSPEAKLVFDGYVSLQRKLAGQRKLMEYLAGEGVTPADWDAQHNPDDAEDTTAAIGEWRICFDALLRDAGAPLPKV
jgi:multidrug resistance efflux pump